MNMERITLKTEDNAILDGIMYLPTNKTKEIIISVHGMTSNCLKNRDEAIATKVNKQNVAYMSFNNRGHDIVSFTSFELPDGKSYKKINGTAYESVLDSYFDIKGAINKALELGYEKIHLQGHSLGCTKIVYTYNKLLENNENDILDKIKSVILLSLIDIPRVMKVFIGSKYQMILDYTKEKIANGNEQELMPNEVFINPISVKTYYDYLVNNKEINFAQYSNLSYEFDKLNNIKANLYMRWGTENELIEQAPSDLVILLNDKVKSNDNKKVDINYISGADHSYHTKFDILANEISDFIK